MLADVAPISGTGTCSSITYIRVQHLHAGGVKYDAGAGVFDALHGVYVCLLFTCTALCGKGDVQRLLHGE